MFVPFVSDVRVGSDTASSFSSHKDQQQGSADDNDPSGSILSGSGAASEHRSSTAMAPSSGEVAAGGADLSASLSQSQDPSDPYSSRLTPPSSPHVGKDR